MHPTILVTRKAKAINHIVERAEGLVRQLELDPALIEALQPKGAKNPQVIEMFRLEALATLMDALTESAGVPMPEPAEEPAPEPEPVTAVTELQGEQGQGLPEPVLTDITAPVEPSAEEHAQTESAPEESTAAEDTEPESEPVAEAPAPAPEPQPKPKGRSRKK